MGSKRPRNEIDLVAAGCCGALHRLARIFGDYIWIAQRARCRRGGYTCKSCDVYEPRTIRRNQADPLTLPLTLFFFIQPLR